MSGLRGLPPGRAGRLWLDRRLGAASHAASLLDRKLVILMVEQDRVLPPRRGRHRGVGGGHRRCRELGAARLAARRRSCGRGTSRRAHGHGGAGLGGAHGCALSQRGTRDVLVGTAGIVPPRIVGGRRGDARLSAGRPARGGGGCRAQRSPCRDCRGGGDPVPQEGHRGAVDAPADGGGGSPRPRTVRGRERGGGSAAAGGAHRRRPAVGPSGRYSRGPARRGVAVTNDAG